MDMNTAKTVMNSVHKEGFNISFEDACRMQPVPQGTRTGGYTVLSLQKGDLTILVWVQFNAELGVIVRKVRSQVW